MESKMQAAQEELRKINEGAAASMPKKTKQQIQNEIELLKSSGLIPEAVIDRGIKAGLTPEQIALEGVRNMQPGNGMKLGEAGMLSDMVAASINAGRNPMNDSGIVECLASTASPVSEPANVESDDSVIDQIAAAANAGRKPIGD